MYHSMVQVASFTRAVCKARPLPLSMMGLGLLSEVSHGCRRNGAHGQVLIVRMNRPERLNALNTEMRQTLAETWTEFRHDKELEVAIFTGTGRGFCAGEDMKETLTTGVPGGTRV